MPKLESGQRGPDVAAPKRDGGSGRGLVDLVAETWPKSHEIMPVRDEDLVSRAWARSSGLEASQTIPYRATTPKTGDTKQSATWLFLATCNRRGRWRDKDQPNRF
jgi:hypothetical protein